MIYGLVKKRAKDAAKTCQEKDRWARGEANRVGCCRTRGCLTHPGSDSLFVVKKLTNPMELPSGRGCCITVHLN